MHFMMVVIPKGYESAALPDAVPGAVAPPPLGSPVKRACGELDRPAGTLIFERAVQGELRWFECPGIEGRPDFSSDIRDPPLY